MGLLDSVVGGLGSNSAMNSYQQSQSYSSTMGSGAAATAFNQQAMQALMAYNAEEAQKQREWASAEAVLSRDWQKEMSDTAHQREVQDMKKAGLNPILSAMGGNGASTPSGAMGSGAAASGGLLSGLTDSEMKSSSYGTSSAESWSNLTEALKAIGQGLSDAMGGIKETINGVWNGVGDVVDGVQRAFNFDSQVKSFAGRIYQENHEMFRGGGAGRGR